jgi:hypothetical protein
VQSNGYAGTVEVVSGHGAIGSDGAGAKASCQSAYEVASIYAYQALAQGCPKPSPRKGERGGAIEFPPAAFGE